MLQPLNNDLVLEAVLPWIFQRLWREEAGEDGQMQRVESFRLGAPADCLLGVMVGFD